MVNEAIQEASAGFAAGVTGTLLGYPLDVIKTRMQTSSLSIGGAFLDVYRNVGVLGFYRGVASPLLSLTILNTMNFSSYAYFTKYFDATIDEPLKIALSAALVGPIASSVSTPFELVKTQMQLDRSEATKKLGSIHNAYRILRAHGISSLYTGHMINTLREMVFLATYFTTYENCKAWFVTSELLPLPIAIATSGGISGALGWLISFPLDNIKSNIQGSSLSNPSTRLPAIQIAKHILATKGLVGLYSGIAPSILRAFLVSASRFSAYEFVINLFDESIIKPSV